MNDLADVSDKGPNSSMILGLCKVPTLDNLNYTETPLSDMLAAWLQGKDNVNNRGEHTWRALVNARKHPLVNQSEIADKIRREKCHTH